MCPLKIAALVLLLLAGLAQTHKKVRVDLFYEALCPGCIVDYTTQIYPVVKELSDYINLYTYPYGAAKTQGSGDDAVVICQHGEEECFGNKLHACIMDELPAFTQYVPIVKCLFDEGSNTTGTEKCAKQFKMNATTIIDCAKNKKGLQLMIYYGELSKMYGLYGVPDIFLNHNEIPYGSDLKKEVCQLLKPKPEACK